LDRLRVTLLLNGMTLTGSPKVAYEVFSRLKDRLALRVIALHDGPTRRQFSKIARVSILPPGSFLDYLKTDGLRSAVPACSLRPLALLESRFRRPDVIYVNGAASLPGLRRLSHDGIPVVLHIHEPDVYLRAYCREFRELLVNRPDRYIAVSNAAKEGAVRHGVDAKRIIVIHNTIPPIETIDGSSVADGRHGDKFVVGGCGDATWAKGVLLWLQMAAEVAQRVGKDSVRFVWLGLDDERASLEFRETARHLGIEDLVECLPTTQDPLSVFAGFDVLAVTSWEETFSMASLECMMLGKTVVCFANGGTPEVIGDTGLCIPDFSPQLMAESIADLVRSPERARALGNAARMRALTYFRIEEQVSSIYHEITAAVSN
jgi:glycosyltransferase involved in cell wall biosynthesis